MDSLEAVVWCLHKGVSYKSTVHLSVTLGNDTDTTPAFAGAIAAIFYREPFPLEWMGELRNTDLLISTSSKFILSFEDQFHISKRL